MYLGEKKLNQNVIERLKEAELIREKNTYFNSR
jgi:hypothetical protein